MRKSAGPDRKGKSVPRGRAKSTSTGGSFAPILDRIRIEEEGRLLAHLEELFNSPAITSLLAEKDRIDQDNHLGTALKGYTFPLSLKFGGKVFETCRKAQGALGLAKLKVEYFVSNDVETNACAFFTDVDRPHFIVLNSGLLEKLDLEELLFVVGHELGHLVYRHSVFSRVIETIYPDPETLPPFIAGVHDLWRKLGEISADRLGLLAGGDIEPAMRAMFKMSSGISMSDFGMDSRAFVEMVDKTLSDLSETPERIFQTHPANPVRVKALEIFHGSKTWNRIRSGKKIGKDLELNQKMEEVLSMLRKMPQEGREALALQFLSAAGILVMTCDGEPELEEYSHLINILAPLHFFPGICLSEYLGKGNPRILKRRMAESASLIVENYPQDVRALLEYLIPLIACDRKIDQREIDVLFDVAENHLKIPRPEAVDMLLNGFVEHFKPIG